MSNNKYIRDLKGVQVDVYDVLKAFNVTCPAMQHAAKKVLCAGIRGHKDALKDKREAIQSIERSIELEAPAEPSHEYFEIDTMACVRELMLAAHRDSETTMSFEDWCRELGVVTE